MARKRIDQLSTDKHYEIWKRFQDRDEGFWHFTATRFTGHVVREFFVTTREDIKWLLNVFPTNRWDVTVYNPSAGEGYTDTSLEELAAV